MFKINLKTQETIREELPQFLVGLDKASLVDLSWVDETLGVSGLGFWEEKDVTPKKVEGFIYDGTESFVINFEEKIVEVTRGTRLKNSEELYAEKKASVPLKITMRQAQLQLLSAGLLDDVEIAINAITDETLKRTILIEWNTAKDIERNSSTIIVLAQLIGIDEDMLDDLFIAANLL